VCGVRHQRETERLSNIHSFIESSKKRPIYIYIIHTHTESYFVLDIISETNKKNMYVYVCIDRCIDV
jgi:hypothetical protein